MSRPSEGVVHFVGKTLTHCGAFENPVAGNSFPLVAAPVNFFYFQRASLSLDNVSSKTIYLRADVQRGFSDAIASAQVM